MSTEPSNKKLPKVVVIAMLLVVLMIGVPTLEYVEYGNRLFGAHTFVKVLLLSGMGGALSTSLCTQGRKQRFIAILPGALMGIGFSLAITAYVLLLHRTTLFKLECVLPTMIGVLPGLLLYVALVKPVSSEP